MPQQKTPSSPNTDPVLSVPVLKHSVRIAGHMTSISLEAPFWDLLHDIAEENETSLNDMISQIDARRGTNLSSALRLFVVDYLRKKAGM